jgi:predicted nucleotide-binding protein
VFVVHGRDDGTKNTVARFLESLDLEAVILHEQPSKGQTIIEKFEANSQVDFAVVLCTGDDMGHLKDSPSDSKLRARQNVILELGFFLGALGRDKVCVLYGEGVELPNDYAGVVFLSLSDRAWRFELANELRAAGITIDMNKL